jgi:uncharacterized protein (DUF952 family)
MGTIDIENGEELSLIYHLAFASDWALAEHEGSYTVSTRGVSLAEQGFIHASTAEQVAGVANAYYADTSDLVLLEIDEDRVIPEIRYEHVPGQSAPYPHIYGPLNVDAVVAVRPYPL